MERARFHDEARGAEAALQRVERHERRCIGCSLAAPMPSTVVIVLSAAAFAGNRQLTTGAPSTSTVQAPHTPAPHTSLVPVRRKPSRKTSGRLSWAAPHGLPPIGGK